MKCNYKWIKSMKRHYSLLAVYQQLCFMSGDIVVDYIPLTASPVFLLLHNGLCGFLYAVHWLTTVGTDGLTMPSWHAESGLCDGSFDIKQSSFKLMSWLFCSLIHSDCARWSHHLDGVQLTEPFLLLGSQLHDIRAAKNLAVVIFAWCNVESESCTVVYLTVYI